MKFLRIGLFVVLVGLDYTLSVFSQSPSDRRANTIGAQLPELLPREKEIDLALGAAPEHLRNGAGLYVLEQRGFVKVRESTNGFTCIVNRDHPLNQKPVCFDAEGTATILPKVLRVGELLMQGKTMSEINSDIAEGFRTGKYISPRRAGVAYMLSGDIRNFNSRTGKVESFPPHVMFYAPNVTNTDLGITAEALAKDPSLPFIGYQGPHGFIIVLAGDKQKIAISAHVEAFMESVAGDRARDHRRGAGCFYRWPSTTTCNRCEPANHAACAMDDRRHGIVALVVLVVPARRRLAAPNCRISETRPARRGIAGKHLGMGTSRWSLRNCKRVSARFRYSPHCRCYASSFRITN
jgi:hypothetical protein